MDDLKTANRVFTVWSDELDGRLDPKFYSPISLAWNEDWKIEKLGKFITRRLEIFPADELSEENFVTLSLNGEIKPKRIMGWRRMKDTLFSSKFFKAKEGDFVFSKIDIRNGASAVIPRGREIAVTAEFPVYAVSDEILPEYLALLFRYKQVLSWLDRKSIGHSGRKRTDGKVVEALPIPVPPIEIQKEMVEKLGNAVEEKRRKEQEIRDILSSIDTFVLGELGVEVPEGGAGEKIFTVWSDEIEGRIDPFFCSPFFKFLREAIEKENNYELGELVEFSRETWDTKSIYSEQFPYIEISSIDTVLGEVVQADYVPVAEAPSRAKMIVRDGDIIISTTRPSRGAIAPISEKENEFIASTGFSVLRDIKNDNLLRDYLLIILRTKLSLLQMEQRTAGGNYPAITTEDLKKIRIVVPSIEKQERIIDGIKRAYSKVKDLRFEMKNMVADAQKKTEQLLFANA